MNRGNVARSGDRQCEAVIVNDKRGRRGNRCRLRTTMRSTALCSKHLNNGAPTKADEIDPRIAERMRAVLEGA